MTDHKHVRCAVYTRKSSEEGLDQSFNSLHAQREACEAYVLSQKHEGWEVILADYDDGGFSGGNMDRPGLKKLLEDIAAKRVDTVVVYKVDRLTRSLADFAKIVEQFDGQGVSFVSVTQQFNTTSSMGRLTLNVLLSFAQFEREVTGERIRDKIAASKRKGMWMGGTIPIGYDLHDRALIIKETEAAQVREIYRLYIELGCVAKLRVRLESMGIRSKKRLSKTGRASGDSAFSRGSLYELLQNPLYLGQVRHKEKVFEGQQPAIVDRGVWDQVQQQLATNRPRRRRRAEEAAILTGILFDDEGIRFTPSHTTKKGKRYHYYVSQSVIDPLKKKAGVAPVRLPAREIEGVVTSEIRSLLHSPDRIADLVSDDPSNAGGMELVMQALEEAKIFLEKTMTSVAKTISRVVVSQQHVHIAFARVRFRQALGLPEVRLSSDVREVRSSAALKRFGGEMRFEVPAENRSVRESPSILRAIVNGRDWLDRILTGSAKSQRDLAEQMGLGECYVGKVLSLAFVTPEMTELVLEGRQPEKWCAETFLGKVHADWRHQHELHDFRA